MNTTLTILLLLSIKHLIIDFFLQTKYQYSNKGTYGHGGGVLHAGLHALGTYLVFSTLTPLALVLGLIDAVIHYHVDWYKVNINKHYGWKPETHKEFWWLLGVDQFLHFLTYILLVTLL